MRIHTLDLEFRGRGTIAAYVVEQGAALAVVETGPDSTWPALVGGLDALGFAPGDVTDVLVTHVHLDHAGAAWHFAEHGATVHVHPAGAAHLAEPGKLLASAKRIYRDRMDELWGTMKPIPRESLRTTTDDETVVLRGGAHVRVLHTPGHAVHHNAYVIEDHAFTGDVGGVKLQGCPVLPPCPPPDIHVEMWRQSIARLRGVAPVALFPTHFGREDDVPGTLHDLEERLVEWSEWVGARLAEGKDEAAIIPEFDAWLERSLLDRGLPAETVAAYRVALPFGMNVPGLIRYWRKVRA